MKSTLTPYTCFKCLRTFKRPFEKDVFYRTCPNCGGQSVQMDIRFRPPKKSDAKQWEKVRFLVSHGFIFQKIYSKEGYIWCRERYPDNLKQARDFVQRFKAQALPIRIPE